MVNENPKPDPDAVNASQDHGRRKLISKLLALAGLGVVGGLLSQEQTGILPSVRASTASYSDSASPVLSATNTAVGDAIYGQASTRAVVGVATGLTGQAVTGFASNTGAIPVVAEGIYGQTASLQEWWIGANNPVSVVDKNGYFGIGTTSVQNPLTVGPNPTAAHNANELLQLAKTNDAYMVVRDGTGTALLGTTSGLPFVGSQSNTDFTIRANNTEQVRITTGGNVGIGTSTPSVRLDVAGEAHATDFVATSDMRFKEEVAPIDGALDKVLRLQGVYFKWNNHYRDVLKRTNTQRRQVGVIAQQVREVLPEVVSEWGDEKGKDYLAVDYDRLMAVAIEAMKEQQKQIQQLSERIATLEGDRKRFASS